MAEGLRHHRALRGRQGNADQGAAAARSRPRALGLGDDARAARGRGGRPRLPLPHAGGVRAADRGRRLPRVRHLQRQPLRDAALRGRAAARRRATRSCSRSRSRAPSRCARRCRSRSRSSSPRRTRRSLRERLEARGTDSAEAIDARLEVAEQELAAQGDFDHRVVNDELDRAADELEEIVRAELGLPLDSAAE